MKCSNCGAEVGTAKFCEYCGAQITAEMLKEQELMKKEGCPKCGSTNVTFRRENQGEVKTKRNKQVLHQTVGICKDCGHTWYPNGKEKKRKTWLWVLGWLFIFPIPLTIILLKKKEMKPALKYGIIAAAWVVFLLAAVLGRGTNRNSEKWPKGTFADRLPVYSSRVDRVSNYNSFISIDIYDVSQEQFNKYTEKCQDAGFNLEIKNGNSEFQAFDNEGYKLSMSYWASLEKLNIYIYEPIIKDAKEISWPKNHFTDRIPKPTSLIGEIDADRSDLFRVYLTDITKNEYNDYVEECRAAGFNVDYRVDDDSFYAEDAEGYALTIKYEGNNTSSIQVKAPDRDKGTTVDRQMEETTKDSATESTTETEIITEESTAEEKTTEAKIDVPTGIRADVKKAIDSYEEFVDEYCEFMKSYDASNLTMLAKYAELIQKDYEMTKKFEKIKDMDLNDEEVYYYTQVELRCSQKLLQYAQDMG